MSVRSLATKKNVSKWFDSLFEDVISATAHLKTAFDFIEAAKAYRREINKSSGFWHYIFWGQIDAATFRLCRVHDETSCSLEKLLTTLNEHTELYDQNVAKEHEKLRTTLGLIEKDNPVDRPWQLAQDIKDTSAANPLVATLRKWRNEHLAHKIPTDILNPEKLGKNFPLRFVDLKALADNALRILNTYSIVVLRSTRSIEVAGNSDFERIFESLRGCDARAEKPDIIFRLKAGDWYGRDSILGRSRARHIPGPICILSPPSFEKSILRLKFFDAFFPEGKPEKDYILEIFDTNEHSLSGTVINTDGTKLEQTIYIMDISFGWLYGCASQDFMKDLFEDCEQDATRDVAPYLSRIYGISERTVARI